MNEFVMGNVKQKMLVVTESMHGTSRVRVELKSFRKDEDGNAKVDKKGNVITVGKLYTGVGGFKYAKDFVYAVARKAAIDNAFSSMNKGGIA